MKMTEDLKKIIRFHNQDRDIIEVDGHLETSDGKIIWDPSLNEEATAAASILMDSIKEFIAKYGRLGDLSLHFAMLVPLEYTPQGAACNGYFNANGTFEGVAESLYASVHNDPMGVQMLCMASERAMMAMVAPTLQGIANNAASGAGKMVSSLSSDQELMKTAVKSGFIKPGEA